jgi:hypothetical protein
MATQIVEGYQRMDRDLKHYFRSEFNAKLIDEQAIANALWESENHFLHMIAEARVHWMIRQRTFDDTALSETEPGLRQLFIKTDIGITDHYRIARIWRKDSDGLLNRVPIDYVPSASAVATTVNPSVRVGSSYEMWTESGDFNANGIHEQQIWFFNPEAGFPGGVLLIEYWFVPPRVTVDILNETDANGDFTKEPMFNQVLHIPILNYAKWVLAELAEEPGKIASLQMRFGGAQGIDRQVENLLGQFQTDTQELVRDVYGDE